MVNIKIKFIGLGIDHSFQAHVKIFGKGKLIFEGDTVNGEVLVCLEEGKVYRVEATFLNEVLCTNIYADGCVCPLYFDHSIQSIGDTVTFLLRDFYYDIPIERGELTLWSRT